MSEHECDCRIELPAIPEVSDCCAPTAWLINIQCQDCMSEIETSTGEDVAMTCGNCGASFRGEVRYTGELSSLAWNLSRT